MEDDKPYTKREIDQHNRAVHEKLDLVLTELKEVKFETKQTNGRVRRLEQWKWFITGGLAILTTLLLPLVLWYLQNRV